MKSTEFFNKYHMAFPMQESVPGTLELISLGGDSESFQITENYEFTREGLKVLGSLAVAKVLPSMESLQLMLEDMEQDPQGEEAQAFLDFRVMQFELYRDFLVDVKVLISESGYVWDPSEMVDANPYNSGPLN